MLEGIWIQTKYDVIHLKYVTGVKVRQQLPLPEGKWDLQAVLVSYFSPVVIDVFPSMEEAVSAKEWFYECMNTVWLDMDDWNAGRTDASKRPELREHSREGIIKKAEQIGRR